MFPVLKSLVTKETFVLKSHKLNIETIFLNMCMSENRTNEISRSQEPGVQTDRVWKIIIRMTFMCKSTHAELNELQNLS